MRLTGGYVVATKEIRDCKAHLQYAGRGEAATSPAPLMATRVSRKSGQNGNLGNVSDG